MRGNRGFGKKDTMGGTEDAYCSDINTMDNEKITSSLLISSLIDVLIGFGTSRRTSSQLFLSTNERDSKSTVRLQQDPNIEAANRVITYRISCYCVNDMSDALFVNNKIDFVNNTIPRPGVDLPNLQYWMRSNAMVKGRLKSAMHKDVSGSVRYANTAREIWADLEEIFGKGSDSRAYEIRRAVTLLRQEKMSVSSYHTKLKRLWDESSESASSFSQSSW
ncbi:hypothetical protein CCACVL1_19638 [Corchorus capsularis]|uniref:Uncharacterized protein n=1 Tax=Corchorus capsularis TaxID=210143 RepID=A0A1R3HFM8_COCAP|nr:hypothetical protein CCACVL1_19638 [Corchorus capsularis]